MQLVLFLAVVESATSDEWTLGLLVRSWNVGGEGTAAVVFDWERSCLEVVFEALNPDTMEFFLGTFTPTPSQATSNLISSA